MAASAATMITLVKSLFAVFRGVLSFQGGQSLKIFLDEPVLLVPVILCEGGPGSPSMTLRALPDGDIYQDRSLVRGERVLRFPVYPTRPPSVV